MYSLEKKTGYGNSRYTVSLFILIFSILMVFSNFLLAQSSDDESFFVPIFSTTRATSKALLSSRQDYGTKIAAKEKRVRSQEPRFVVNDTTKKENKIVSLDERFNGDGYLLYLELEDYEHTIQIAAYNLLGKKVLDIYNGNPYKDAKLPYDIPTVSLPNGVYICFVFGKNFRLQQKFIVSR